MSIDPVFLEYFVDRVNVYRPAGTRTNADGMTERSGAELVAEDVICMMDPKGEGATTGPFGRLNKDIQLTLDIFYFADDGPDIEGGWMIELVTPGHPDYGRWFAAVGGKQSWAQMAGAFGVSCNRVLKPGVSP